MADPADNPNPGAAADEPTDPTPSDPPKEEPTPEPTNQPLGAGGGSDEPPAEPKHDWPEDWRDKLAGDDEKLRKRLDRFSSPADILKSWRSAEQKISSGEYKQSLPDDATEEQIAEWRKENGVPEKPDGYKENLRDGLVLGEADKPVVDSFAEAAHKANMPQEQFNEALSWYYDFQEQAQAERAQQDREVRQQAEDELRSEWGNEYRANLNAISNLMESAPEGLKDKLLSARAEDGSGGLLGDDPAVIKWLVNLSKEVNPAATVVPNAGNSMEAIQSEKAKLESMMGNHNSEYWKGPNADRNQKRYLELVEAEERMKR